MTKLYDALIIGGGPAGLSAALALGRVHRTCVVFSDDKYRNAGAHAAHSILTRDHVDPAEIRRLGRKDIERYNNTQYAGTTVTKIIRKQSGAHSHFLAHNADGQTWQGRSLILAAGVRDQFPDLPGYAENWPTNIYQCPFCDGHERSTGPLGVLSFPEFNPAMGKLATLAHFLSQPVGTPVESITSSNVTFFSNGPVDSSSPTTTKFLETLAAHHIDLEQRSIIRLESSTSPNKEGLYVHLRNPDTTTSRIYMGFLYHKPRTAPSCPELIEQLGLEVEHGPFGDYVKTAPPMNSTNISGVFACGDAGTMMTQSTVAMASGNAAAAAVAHYVAELDDEIALERYRSGLRKGTSVDGTANREPIACAVDTEKPVL